jgi:DNA polymerase-3 subunit delta'
MPFRDIVGHRRVIQLLSRSIARQSLPPSLILAGPEGVGKRLTAIAAAQALNCISPVLDEGSGPPERPGDQLRHERGGREPLRHESGGHEPEALEIDACGACPTCTRILRGIHPDVLVLEPGETGTIKIEAVRDVVDRAAYRPFEGRRRVVIIDDADALVAAAQNAMLKTLEEPPASSVFMLVTANPDLLLATVRSRCPRLSFRPLGPEEVAAALMRQGRSEPEARAVAATADGSVGRALGVSGGELVEARDVALRVLAHAAATDDPRRRIDSARDLLEKTGRGGAGDREQLAVHLRAMASLIRDTELLSTGADATALANTDVQTALARLAAFRGDRGLRAFATIDQALDALARNAGVKVVADWVVLHL